MERFGVWQNVHAVNLTAMRDTSPRSRIQFHIQSWYSEVEDFDTAEFGLVNFTARWYLSYIPFALSTISQVGCGRAIYTARPEQSTRDAAETARASVGKRTIGVGFGDRVEALVCNYGPLDRNTPRELYEDGVPALCPPGTTRSLQYLALCQKFQVWQSQGETQQNGKGDATARNSSASSIKPAVHLVRLLLLLPARLSLSSTTYSF
ncbi:uncharacterized protein LOC113464095 [Ceratina calcarata]|uniref:Uncharacterized protein LOC113464095 n=1 Tax=Ceratina calcarata TaxID=156304 RepID=A0AAJ7RY41_9HYME|nr:uncharacterized protein LOC113464095 [Ceratina calcarata]